MDKKVAKTEKKTAKKREKIEYKSYSFVDKALAKLGMKNEKERKRVGGIISVSLFSILITAWVAAALYGSMFITGLVFGMTKDIFHYEAMNETLLELILEAIIYALAVCVTIFLPWTLLKKHGMKTTRNEMGLRGWPTWTDILLSVGGYLVATLIGGALLFLGQAVLPMIDWEQAQEVGFQNIYVAGDLIMAYIALAIVAPICEELIFRGWLYGKLRAKIPAFPAIVLVSLLFALVHGQWNVGVIVFAMSVINCLIRELTGTVYGGILVHIIRNSIAFYGLFILHMV